MIKYKYEILEVRRTYGGMRRESYVCGVRTGFGSGFGFRSESESGCCVYDSDE